MAKRVPVVVSMTSIAGRVDSIGPTLLSILKQTYPVAQIRLYLPDGTQLLPHMVPAKIGARLVTQVIAGPDPGPVAKISAVLAGDLPRGALVVTIDDDQVYDRRWLEKLVAAAEKRPQAAVGCAGWNVNLMLADPERGTYDWAPAGAPCDVLEGFAGVAYRPEWFDPDILEPPPEYRLVDDVWISSYLRRRGIERYRVLPKMCKESHGGPGLHTRPDFVELNRRAAVMGFAGKSPIEHEALAIAKAAPAPRRDRPRLSICIPTLIGPPYDRTECLGELLRCLRDQPRIGEVEILMLADSGAEPTGRKRTRLYHEMAQGDYVVSIDDDDLVAPTYVQDVLEAIERSPGVDVVLVRGRRTIPGEQPIVFDYRLGGAEGELKDGVLWHSPAHLCPIRRELARQVPFEEVVGEDLIWLEAIKPHLRTSVRAGVEGRVLYYYHYDVAQASPHRAHRIPAPLKHARGGRTP